ncbi:MAG: response regulator [Elusimicrobia bacterium]|nr:response regulator [Candidatus Obscuribacterium magneticum]
MSEKETQIVMVVDDEEGVRDFVRMTLTKVGLSIIEERDATSAMKSLETKIPDLILLDIMMPNMDGFELCRRIRANPTLAYIPIIFITAYADKDSLKKAVAVGAQGFIEKPIEVEELIHQVKEALHGRFTMPKKLKLIGKR